MSAIVLESACLSNQLELSVFPGHAAEAKIQLETVTRLVAPVTASCSPNNTFKKNKKTFNM